MRVSPDEKLTLINGGNKTQTLSGLRGRSSRKMDQRCQQILRTIVEGKVAIIVMSIVTVFALVGVCNNSPY